MNLLLSIGNILSFINMKQEHLSSIYSEMIECGVVNAFSILINRFTSKLPANEIKQ